jgi:uncharacterized protein (TIGR02271 family)
MVAVKIIKVARCNYTIMEDSLDWNQIIKKQARGNDDIDLGEVKAVGQQYIMTQKGVINRETFYFPKYLVKAYEGDVLTLNVSQDQLERFTKEEPPVREDYTKYRKEGMPAGVEAGIPVVGEKLQVSKTTVTEEAIIFKEPVTEFRLVEVPVTHEELRIVRKPVAAGSMPSEKQAAEPGEVRILLSREEVQVVKKSYVYEEVLVRKERVAGTKTVSEAVTSEKVYTGEAQT